MHEKLQLIYHHISTASEIGHHIAKLSQDDEDKTVENGSENATTSNDLDEEVKSPNYVENKGCSTCVLYAPSVENKV